ncbi:MAG: helix-turn-helix domain-containing protein [Gemmatimonadota bacterium]
MRPHTAIWIAWPKEGSFREDLLYRLKVVTIELPPLRDRREDIPPIAVSLIAELAARHGRSALPLSDAARRALLAYDWPGNVRELRNTLERAIVLAEGPELDTADLPAQLAGTRPLSPTESVLAELPFSEARTRALDAFDRAFLAAALERHDGNVSATARALGLHRQSLQKLLRRIEPADPQ